MCQHSYYKSNSDDIKIYCRHEGQTICLYSMYCDLLGKWKVNENREEYCILRDKPIIKIPNDANWVRFEKSNKLYIEYQDMVVTIANPYDYIPDFVYLVEIGNELYIKGFEPKKVEVKVKEVKEEESK